MPSIDYSPIIERLEKATGPDRELDDEIFVTVLARETEQGIKDGQSILSTVVDALADDLPPAYTGSIDAALALVEKMRPGWWLGIHQFNAIGHKFRACLSRPWESGSVCKTGETRPLAVLSVLFRSLSEQGGA